MRQLFHLTACLFSSNLLIQAQTVGCTDKLATNFNANATINDGSCLYATTPITFLSSLTIDATLKETSGLIHWENLFWSHNDDNDNKIYAIHTTTGSIDSSITLNGLEIHDWEELQHDSLYLYIGDMGNNATGIRQNLAVYKITKSSLFSSTLLVDTIHFSYAAQIDFSTSTSNTTNFDCEAFIVSADSIYFFAKEWTHKKSTIYSIPNQAGHHTAQPIFELDVNGLITGACWAANKDAIVLCGYSTILQPFIYMITDLDQYNFSKANKRKLTFNNLLGYQTEAIATADGHIFYLTNEQFSMGGTTIQQQIHTVDLSNFFPKKNTISIKENAIENVKIYPNPSHDIIVIDNATAGLYEIINNQGQIVQMITLQTPSTTIDVSRLSAGSYFLKKQHSPSGIKFIIQQ